MLCSKCGKAFVDKNGYCVRCREVTLYVKPLEPVVITKPLLGEVQLCLRCSTAYVDITGYCPRCRAITVSAPIVEVETAVAATPKLSNQPLGKTAVVVEPGEYVATKVEEDEAHELAGEEDSIE